MSNLPSNRVQDSVSYEVVCQADRSLRFQVMSDSEAAAKFEALEKIGFGIVSTHGLYYLVDADDPTIVESLIPGATTLPEAFQAAFPLIGWELSEPTQLLGGSMASGFGEMTEDNS